jgi:hypothetical protein
MFEFKLKYLFFLLSILLGFSEFIFARDLRCSGKNPRKASSNVVRPKIIIAQPVSLRLRAREFIANKNREEALVAERQSKLKREEGERIRAERERVLLDEEQRVSDLARQKEEEIARQKKEEERRIEIERLEQEMQKKRESQHNIDVVNIEEEFGKQNKLFFQQRLDLLAKQKEKIDREQVEKEPCLQELISTAFVEAIQIQDFEELIKEKRDRLNLIDSGNVNNLADQGRVETVNDWLRIRLSDCFKNQINEIQEPTVSGFESNASALEELEKPVELTGEKSVEIFDLDIEKLKKRKEIVQVQLNELLDRASWLSDIEIDCRDQEVKFNGENTVKNLMTLLNYMDILREINWLERAKREVILKSIDEGFWENWSQFKVPGKFDSIEETKKILKLEIYEFNQREKFFFKFIEDNMFRKG